MSTRTLAPIAAAAVLLLPAALAHATVPADLCTGNPCLVSGAVVVDADSVLDFGAGTELRLTSTAQLTIGPGSEPRGLTLIAGQIQLQSGARILGGGANADVRLESTSGDVGVATNARIDLSDAEAGIVTLVSAANLVVGGLLDVRGLGIDAQGGTIDLQATGAITVTGELTAAAISNDASGGGIAIAAGGAVAVGGTLTTDGDFGAGDIEIGSTAGNVAVTAKIDLGGGPPEGSGGSITINAPGGDASIGGSITGKGGAGAQEACGDGASLTVQAGRDVVVSGPITVTGGRHCLSGDVTITAGRDLTQLAAGVIEGQGPGGFGGGGSVTLLAGRDAVVRKIDVTSAGGAGVIQVQSGASLRVEDRLDVRGTASFASPGTVQLQSCELVVAAAGRLSALGDASFGGGTNTLRASGAMTIAGTLEAEVENVLRHLGAPPTITGTVTPAATIVQDPTLPACPVLPVCGNDAVEEGEACDDGNTLACDGCNATCTREDDECGDGVPECGEACDDGNDVDGDGCETTCELTPLAGARLPGKPRQATGCFAEWSLPGGSVLDPLSGYAAERQPCTDGDPACDSDGAVNGSCTFEVRTCLRVPDPGLPSCDPAALAAVRIRKPRSTGDLVDQANFATLRDAIAALGVTVEEGIQVVRPGSPQSELDSCTAPMLLQVPTVGTKPGARKLLIGARDAANAEMKKNQVILRCKPRLEACGDGVRDSDEECDLGAENGQDGSRCSASCKLLPSAMRVPGGSGKRSMDCAFEWSADLNENDVRNDGNGVPTYGQVCRDNDPACDHDPAAGNCRVRVWACVGAEDDRLGCGASTVTNVQILRPRASDGDAYERDAREAMQQALDALGLPAGPGESCTPGFLVDVPVGASRLQLSVKATFAGSKKDSDALILRCLR